MSLRQRGSGSVPKAKRLFVNYIQLNTEKKEFLLNVSEAGAWVKKIVEMREKYGTASAQQPAVKAISSEQRKKELHDMLTSLRNASLLSEKEFEEKAAQLFTMKF